MSERKPNLLSIAAGAAAIGVIGGIAAYFYFNYFKGIPPRDGGDVVSSAKVVPDEAWIVGLLSTAPKNWAQLEKLGNSQFNNVPIVGLLVREAKSQFNNVPLVRLLRRETNSVAGLPPFLPQSLGTLGTPKPRPIISQTMQPLTRSTISQRMRPLTRSTISQRMRPLTRSTISQRMRPLSRSTRNRMQECNGGFSYSGRIIAPRSSMS